MAQKISENLTRSVAAGGLPGAPPLVRMFSFQCLVERGNLRDPVRGLQGYTKFRRFRSGVCGLVKMSAMRGFGIHWACRLF